MKALGYFAVVTGKGKVISDSLLSYSTLKTGKIWNFPKIILRPSNPIFHF